MDIFGIWGMIKCIFHYKAMLGKQRAEDSKTINRFNNVKCKKFFFVYKIIYTYIFYYPDYLHLRFVRQYDVFF